jgi:hypothetical protein
MAEAQGQVETQPALSALNPSEAVAELASQIEAEETPRDDRGKFVSKTPATEEEATAKPEKEAEAEDEEAPVQEQTQEEAKAEARRLKLKYKGEEKEVDEAEAIELAQKGFDYTQKSQALAKEREELSAKAKAAEEAARSRYEQQLEIQKQTVLKLVDQEALNADLNKLALEDPARAQQLFFKKIQIQQTLAQIEAAQQQVYQQRQAEMQEAMSKQAKEAVERLQERIPGWNNDLYGKILKGASESYGFQSNEVNAITDHRAIEVLHDALKWREFQAAKPKTVEKRVAAVPKVQKPGTTEKADPKANRIQESMARLNKSGSRQDAQDAILAMMEAGRL